MIISMKPSTLGAIFLAVRVLGSLPSRLSDTSQWPTRPKKLYAGPRGLFGCRGLGFRAVCFF